MLCQFNEDFIKSYNEDGNIGYFLETVVQYPNSSYNLHNDLPFVPETMKIEKVEKLVANLHYKKEYVIQSKKFKTSTKLWNNIEKMQRAMKLNQEAWLKLYIDLNTELRKNAKNDFEKDFFKLMNNAVFRKTMENVRNRLIRAEARRNYLVSEPDFHTTIFFRKGISNKNEKNMDTYK